MSDRATNRATDRAGKRPAALPSWPDQPLDTLAGAALSGAAWALVLAALVGLTCWVVGLPAWEGM